MKQYQISRNDNSFVYVQFTYYVKRRDSPEEWKCQPNKWLSTKEEIHEILVGWFSVTIGSALSAALATWVVNGGHTTLYYQVFLHICQYW